MYTASNITPQILILELDSLICSADQAQFHGLNTRIKKLDKLDELVPFLVNWLTVMGEEPGFIIISAHGIPSRITVKNYSASLSLLLSQLEIPFTNKAIHVSACKTFDARPSQLRSWMMNSKASLISGYSNNVSISTSHQIENKIIQELRGGFYSINNVIDAFELLRRQHPDLVKRSGLISIKAI
jgi:hypothetical protein